MIKKMRDVPSWVPYLVAFLVVSVIIGLVVWQPGVQQRVNSGQLLWFDQLHPHFHICGQQDINVPLHHH